MTTALAVIGSSYAAAGGAYKPLVFETSNIERMRIDSSGTISLGNLVTPASANIHLDLYCNSSYDSFIRFRDESGAPGLIGFDHGSNAMQFYTNGSSEAMRIDSDGRLLVGTTVAPNLNNAGGASARYPLATFYNTTTDPSKRYTATFIGGSDNANGALIRLGKTRGTSATTPTIVSDGDAIGRIDFVGADGTQYVEAAKITCEVDGTPGANDMPGRLVFSTTADGASSATERLRILSTGGITFNGDTTSANALNDYEEGTFTPLIRGAGATGTFSGNQYGSYTKIGRQVSIQVRLENFTLSGATGAVMITGLPFSAALPIPYSVTDAGMLYGINFTGTQIPAWYGSTGTSNIYGIQSINGAAWASWDVSNFTGSGYYVLFSMTYEAG